jgi:hypothetical protein
MTRPEALAKLAALPDLPGMGRHYTVARDPKRDPWVIKRALGIAHNEWLRQEWTDGDISCVVSVRRLRMVKRA